MASGKIGVIGYCSGGRQAYLAACTLQAIDSVTLNGRPRSRLPRNHQRRPAGLSPPRIDDLRGEVTRSDVMRSRLGACLFIDEKG